MTAARRTLRQAIEGAVVEALARKGVAPGLQDPIERYRAGSAMIDAAGAADDPENFNHLVDLLAQLTNDGVTLRTIVSHLRKLRRSQ
jgi:hypothetical protein